MLLKKEPKNHFNNEKKIYKTFENLLCFEALINTESPLNVTMNFSLVTTKRKKKIGRNKFQL